MVERLVDLLTTKSPDYVPIIPIYVTKAVQKEAESNLDWLDWDQDLPQIYYFNIHQDLEKYTIS